MKSLRDPATLADVLDDIGRWVRHESPSHDARAIEGLQDIIAEQALNAGLGVRRIPLGQGCAPVLVVSNRASGDEREGILVLTHVDTVHPHGTLARTPYRIEDDRVYGPGGYDMKGGAYLALRALAATLNGSGTRLPVEILFIPDEEISSKFSRETTIEFGKRARYALVCEPARNGGKCVTCRKGVGRATITVTGRAAHAGIDHARGRNAIAEMAHHIIDLEALTDYAAQTTVNVGVIAGGTGANVVPDTCTLQVDFRVASADAGQSVLAAMRGLRSRNPDVSVAVDAVVTRPPYEKSRQTAALLDIARLHARQAGFELEDVPLTGGGSDGNFTAALGVPTLDGLGVDGSGAHTLNEFFLASSVMPRLDFWTRLLTDLE
jgi:glutamate carboxypeptidase